MTLILVNQEDNFKMTIMPRRRSPDGVLHTNLVDREKGGWTLWHYWKHLYHLSPDQQRVIKGQFNILLGSGYSLRLNSIVTLLTSPPFRANLKTSGQSPSHLLVEHGFNRIGKRVSHRVEWD